MERKEQHKEVLQRARLFSKSNRQTVPTEFVKSTAAANVNGRAKQMDV